MTAKMTSADQQHYELLRRTINHLTVENDNFGSRNKILEEEMQKLLCVLANVNIKQTILEKIFTQFSSLDTKLFEEHVKKVMTKSQNEASSGAVAEEHAAASGSGDAGVRRTTETDEMGANSEADAAPCAALDCDVIASAPSATATTIVTPPQQTLNDEGVTLNPETTNSEDTNSEDTDSEDANSEDAGVDGDDDSGEEHLDNTTTTTTINGVLTLEEKQAEEARVKAAKKAVKEAKEAEGKRSKVAKLNTVLHKIVAHLALKGTVRELAKDQKDYGTNIVAVKGDDHLDGEALEEAIKKTQALVNEEHGTKWLAVYNYITHVYKKIILDKDLFWNLEKQLPKKWKLLLKSLHEADEPRKLKDPAGAGVPNQKTLTNYFQFKATIDEFKIYKWLYLGKIPDENGNNMATWKKMIDLMRDGRFHAALSNLSAEDLDKMK
jgi:hypothetical protein